MDERVDVIAIFDTVTGRRIGRLPASSWKWTGELNSSGSASATINLSQDTVDMDLRENTRPWRTILAVIDGDRVRHAGPIYQREWDSDTLTLTLQAGGFWDYLKRRLVLTRQVLAYTGGVIPTSEDEFPPQWRLNLSGSLGDIARALVAETLQWGTLPVILPPVEGGQNVRTYLGPDFASVAARLEDLTKVINGPEMLFQPRLEDGGARLAFHMLTGSPELVTATHTWDQRRSATPITGLHITEDASTQTGDAWAKAGAQDDTVLLARTHDMWLEDAGWPLLQASDSSHTTVSDIATLRSYTDGSVAARTKNTESITFKARRTDEAGGDLGNALTVGDHIHLRAADPYLGDQLYRLKVIELSGDEGDWVSVGCREVA